MERLLADALEQRIAALVGPLVEAEGFDLVRIRITGATRPVVQVMAERPDRTMSAEDCASLSRAISAAIDEADPIAGAWTLEVSSPGLDRPLTRPKDFEDWQGYEARIELDRAIEGRKRFRGVLAGLDGDAACVDLEGEEETALIPLAWIKSAKLVLTDELVRESLRAAKAAGKETENDAEDGALQ